MILREGLKIGPRHHLYIGDCDAVMLAREFGTPLYVMDEVYLRGMCRAFVTAMNTFAPGGRVHYASKAFSTTAMCRIAMKEGMGLDVVSGGELYTAQKAGFPMELVTLHGNCKTPGEVRMAIELGVGHIVVDSRSEIPLLQSIAEALDKRVDVQIRLNPNINAHTHDAVKTAVDDCKFGLSIDKGEALAAVKHIAACRNLRLTGVHTHIGSQIFDIAPYLQAVERLTDFMMLASMVTGAELTELVIGGGFGVRYTRQDPPTMDPRETVRAIAREMHRQVERKGLKPPRLILEPGRIIVAEAGVMLYTVGAVKEIPGVRTYVSVDGGMADNPRVALYQSQYEALLANRAGEPLAGRYMLAGRACESGDLLGEYTLPTPEVGDIVAMLTAGAYQYSMAGNYNRLPIPAVALVRYGKADLIVERQRYEDLVQYDRVPGWL
ncbi:MAG: diaminopimelate decarboxylase [Oscillospiraceae bacterium]|jgi:diaminopimelate decarboxylase|nr:diaminopimelate decarboxylase [Oscillospiraceae bacterium]